MWVIDAVLWWSGLATWALILFATVVAALHIFAPRNKEELFSGEG